MAWHNLLLRAAVSPTEQRASVRSAGVRMKVLMLSPESPYPLHGGGAYRTASLLHYFARFAQVDLILISDSGEAAPLPRGLVSSQQVIPLPLHSRNVVARYVRNARRAIRGMPPLVDRLGGLDEQIEKAIGGRHYDIAIVEHFWCAPYVDLMAKAADRTFLNLHNIESVLHDRCAAVTAGPVRAGHARFASAARRMEASLLPKYSLVLATSATDAFAARTLAPNCKVVVYPNSLPAMEIPQIMERPRVVFSANFEYHPNIDAVEFLVKEIWPEVHRRHPALELRLVGKGDRFIKHLLPSDSNIRTTGPVEDAFYEISQASLVVAPLRAGSGTRIKILEAWAAARAVVATPMAAEGLDAHDSGNLAFAADSTGFVAAIDWLLADARSRKQMGISGRRTFEARYSWEAAWKKLDLDLQLT